MLQELRLRASGASKLPIPHIKKYVSFLNFRYPVRCLLVSLRWVVALPGTEITSPCHHCPIGSARGPRLIVTLLLIFPPRKQEGTFVSNLFPMILVVPQSKKCGGETAASRCINKYFSPYPSAHSRHFQELQRKEKYSFLALGAVLPGCSPL